VQYELDRRKIVARLLLEGWEDVGGGKHDRFVKRGYDMVVLPRHTTISLPVARSIAKIAGWKGKR
jgi:hypothetical protein